MPLWAKLTFTTVLVAFVAVVVSAILCAIDARTAYADLRDAQQQVGRLQDQVLAEERQRVERSAAELQESTGAARDSLTGPHWTIIGWLPWIGDDVRAIQTIAITVDDLANSALGDLVDAVGVVDPANLSLEGGRLDLDPIVEVAPRVVGANETVQNAVQSLEDIDTDGLIGLVADAVDQLEGEVDEIGQLTATASRAVQLLPPMMGHEEPREYLLLVQNNAEPRATGGIPGAVLLLRADSGAVEIVDQHPAGGLGPGRDEDPVLSLDDAEESLYGTRMGRYIQNVTFTPDFPRSAQLAQAMWDQSVGGEVDGVVSIDPVALGEVLGPVGNVTVPGGQQLTSETTSQILLNEVYLEIDDPQAQDAFFQAAASEIFDQAISGEADASAMIDVLDGAAAQGRLKLWSSHDDEQELISGTNLSGELRGHYDGSPIFGVYVNDYTAAKLGYYEQLDARVEPQQCTADGSQRFNLTVTLRSRVPSDFEDLPRHLIGTGRLVELGDVRTQVAVYAPTNGEIVDFSSSGGQIGVAPTRHDGLHVTSNYVILSPGETETLTYTIETDEPYRGDPLLRLTPGPSEDQFAGTASPCR
ncbi:DUF4012 domain-containing protein [Georgenia deserti]|uniref:DUF4012 domain-containing protein n=1 Tax=Georgenia deserti TaxID=2093781 RepID=A0ABW4L457_9MICO